MSLFCCPNCMAPLSRQQNRMVCPAGHSFDMARSGYVNLLLSQQISQKHHGDDKRMVCARSAFLAGGYYDPMRQELIRQAMVEARPGMTVLDAGCGEGYYTAELVRRLREGGYAPQGGFTQNYAPTPTQFSGATPVSDFAMLEGDDSELPF